VSSGVLALGHCRFYAVGREAIVIGEIATAAASQGKGYATRTVMLAINNMIRAGSTVFYIDTQRRNTPMIRSIEKLGFGPPVGGDAAGIGP
jgi:RimJ/RimL family protein N-acetyltransferase